MTPELKSSIIILKRLKGILQLGELSLQYLEQQMGAEFSKHNRDENALNNIRLSMFCTINSSLIWFVSFKEEYMKHFGRAVREFSIEQLADISRKNQPHFDRVKKEFANLPEIRNTILAHGYRLKEKKHLPDDVFNDLFNEVTNRNSLEPYYTLSNASTKIIANIESAFGEVDAEIGPTSNRS